LSIHGSRPSTLLTRLKGYLFREIIWSEHTIINILDQLSLLMLTPFNLVGKGLTISERLRNHLETHKAHYIMKKYGIVLKYPPKGLPLDIFWRDYFLVPEFLTNNRVVIDVGASIGDFAIAMAKGFGANKVIAIEPDKLFFKYLICNIKLNRLSRKVIPLNIALGEQEGLITLHKVGFQLSIKGGGFSSKYACTTLDKLVERMKIEDVDLIKIDTEGSEYAIIKGSLNTLKSHKPKLIIEVHSRRDKYKIINILKNLGYELVYEKPNFPKGYKEHDYISVLYFNFK